LESGKDIIRVTWKLKSSVKIDVDAAIKTVDVRLCYAPISQVDRPWRQSHNELFKDKTCPYKIVSKPYDKISQSLNWIIERDIPTGTYFVRVYGIDANGHETTNLFSVEAIDGRHISLDAASICFSIFSVVALLVFFMRERRRNPI
ncbi:hypothetical protein EUTSA_v10027123mg, partial [Eutrema salsugineum]